VDHHSAVPDSEPSEPTTLRTLGTILPIGAAIAVFGAIYGAAAEPILGVSGTIASSLLIFSGALQFATLSLAAGGAGPLAILLTALALNMRNVVLGAMLRPRLEMGAVRRAALAWFLVDESFGLAYAAHRRAAAMLLAVGIVCYVSWQLGTVVGLLGASLGPLQDVAGAIFPILFIGLTALTATRPSLAIRAVAAALLVVATAVVLPGLHPVAPVVAAVVVAVPGRQP